MKTTWPAAKIKGKVAYGLAHIQPRINEWIGVCIIPSSLLGGDPESWKSAIIEYEGLFNSEEERTNGKGKAKILHFTAAEQENQFIINIEGIGKPELEKRLVKKLTFSYDENLPVNINPAKKRKSR